MVVQRFEWKGDPIYNNRRIPFPKKGGFVLGQADLI